MFRLQRAIGVVALAVVLVAASACSGGGDKDLASSNPKAALAAAARETAKDGTVKMSFAASLGASGGLSVAEGDGAYDFKTDRGRFKLAIALGQTIELVLTKDKLYLKQPATQPSDKTWRSATLDELAANSSTSGFLGQLRGQVDPRDMLRNLGTTVRDAKKIGTQKVRGVDTTHISGTVDLTDEAIAKAPKNQQDALRQSRQAVGSDSYPIDVWLDKEGRVRRVEYQLAVGTGAAGSSAKTTVRLDLFGFGEDAGIVIPDPADVEEGFT
jgi:hypothetical protein